MITQDMFEAQQRQIAEQAAANERGRRQNVETFTNMFLSLGADVVKLAGTAHDAELIEARGLAAYRWEQLLGMEAQVGREEQALALRPKKRPRELGDDLLAAEAIKRFEQAFEDQTKHRVGSLAELKKLAAAERNALESFTKK